MLMISYLTSYMDVAEMMSTGDGKNPSSATDANDRDKPVVGNGKGKPPKCGKGMPYKNCKPPGSSK